MPIVALYALSFGAVQCCTSVIIKEATAMSAVVEITIIAAAVIWSAVIIVVLLSANLHKTPLCGIAGMGVTAMVWRAFPPAHDLPQVFGVAFWILTSLLIYSWPAWGAPAPDRVKTSAADEDRLEQFFQGDGS